MTAREPLLLGLLAALVSLSACSAAGASDPRTQSAAEAYAPPSGAPRLCAELIRSTHFADIAPAVGRLDARSRLAAARGELRTLAAGLPAGEWADLRASLDGVVTGLRAVLDPPASDEDR